MVRVSLFLAILLLVSGALVTGSPGVQAAPGTELFLPVMTGGPAAEVSIEGYLEASFEEDVDAGLMVSGQGVPWNNHAPPFDFKFMNHKDQHQQSKIVPAAKAGKSADETPAALTKLIGFLYIDYTDTSGDIPAAQHVDCSSSGGENDPNHEINCRVGWLMHGVSGKAMVAKKGEGRPQYCIDAALQPWYDKGYQHFHWVNPNGQSHEGGEGSEGHQGMTKGDVVDGYLIRLTAVDHFIFFHSGNDQHGGPPDNAGGGGSHEEGGCSHDDSGDDACGGSGGSGEHTDGSGCSDSEPHEEGACDSGHTNTPGSGEDMGSGCSDGETHDEEGCGEDHDMGGGCSGEDGGTHEGGCSGDHQEPGDGEHGVGIEIVPGPDPISHANVVVVSTFDDCEFQP